MDIHSGGTDRLTNAKSGTVLDLSRSGHTVVMGYGWNGGDNQKWILQQQKNGLWTIRNAADNKYLGIKGGLHTNATPVVGVDEAVYWDIKRDTDKDANYRLFVPGKSLNLDLAGKGDSKNGTPVQIWNKWTPGVNQTWKLHKDSSIKSGKTYKLTNVKSGTVLDLSRSGHTVVAGYNWRGNANQKWILQQHKNGLWTLQCVADQKYLGIEGGLHKEGTPAVGVNEAVYWNVVQDTLNPANYRIFVPGENLNVDLTGRGDPREGTKIKIWGKWSPGENQTWTFSEGGSSKGKICRLLRLFKD